MRINFPSSTIKIHLILNESWRCDFIDFWIIGNTYAQQEKAVLKRMDIN